MKDTPTNQLMINRLQWLAQKQQVVANNIAHADNPRFTPRQIEPFRLNTPSLTGIQASVTHPKHIPIGPKPLGDLYKIHKIHSAENQDVGNGVILEEQMLEVSNTQNQYAQMIHLYRRQHKLLNIALGK